MRSKPIWGVMFGVLGALALLFAPHAHGQCQYEVTVVTGPPCFPDPNISIGLEGINDLGQVCGWEAICGQVGAKRPLVWTPEQGIILLPLPEGATEGVANDINNVIGSDGFGQVACTLVVPAVGGDRAFLYDDGEWTDLGLLPGALIARAFAINDDTELVGECHNPISGPFQAFIWQSGTLSALDLPIGPQSSAADINKNSLIVGWMGSSSSSNDGFMEHDRMIDSIPLLPQTTTSQPAGVNQSETVTGNSRIPVKSGPIEYRSWVFDDFRLTDLGDFADTYRNIAQDINNAGQIIGSCFALLGAETSYLWQDGELIRLDDFVDLPQGVTLAAVKAINNRGQIAGNSGGASHGIILTPIVPLGDVNLDCEVDGDDLALVLGDWGRCLESGSCQCDIVTSSTFQPPGDGVVDGADLAVVLGNWTEQSSSLSRRN